MVTLTDQPKGGGMPAVQTRQVVEGYLRGHGGEWLAETVEFFEPGSAEPHRGRSEVAQWLAGFYAGAFSEARAEPVALVVDGERAGYEFVFSGLHSGSLFGEAPSGRSVRVPMAAFYEVKDGEIVAGRLYYDTGCLRAQLGGPDRSEGTSSPGGSAPRRPR
jgi:ketosteroid isomerase-like protein